MLQDFISHIFLVSDSIYYQTENQKYSRDYFHDFFSISKNINFEKTLQKIPK